MYLLNLGVKGSHCASVHKMICEQQKLGCKGVGFFSRFHQLAGVPGMS